VIQGAAHNHMSVHLPHRAPPIDVGAARPPGSC
jgi:hypothetical protein